MVLPIIIALLTVVINPSRMGTTRYCFIRCFCSAFVTSNYVTLVTLLQKPMYSGLSCGKRIHCVQHVEEQFSFMLVT